MFTHIPVEKSKKLITNCKTIRDHNCQLDW